MESLLTRWGRTLDRDHPLNEYPRPQLKRGNTATPYNVIQQNKDHNINIINALTVSTSTPQHLTTTYNRIRTTI